MIAHRNLDDVEELFRVFVDRLRVLGYEVIFQPGEPGYLWRVGSNNAAAEIHDDMEDIDWRDSDHV